MQDNVEISRDKFDHFNEERLIYQAEEGLTEELVREISKQKNEPEWMLQKRLNAFRIFQEKPMPDWGPDLSKLDLTQIRYFLRPDAKRNATSWEDVPEDIRKTFEKLGIPEAERTALAGAGTQYESDVVYHNLKKEWEDKGVIFLDMDEAVQKHPELVKKYFMSTCVSPALHKFAALHGAVWSGGTFIYVPRNVKVDLPLQAYFRMNARKGGQFEHTLIIIDENAEMQYIEGCSSPVYNESGLHAGCVEVHVLKGARARYSSIENWSKNTFNLNTKRAIVHENAVMEWINGNMGCLAGDSKILTNPKGPIDIKDIKKGDKVYVWDQKTNSIKKSLVKSMIFSGIKMVYKLEAGGRQIEASSNHPFLTLIRRKNNTLHKKGFFHYEWKPLEELKEGDLIGIAKRVPIEGNPHKLPKFNYNYAIKSKNQYSDFKMNSNHLYNSEIIMPDETNNDFMWLMGILLGDGCVDLPSNKTNIAIHKNDDVRRALLKTVKELFNYEIKDAQDRYVEIYSKALADLFTKIGFSGDAYTKKVPDWVFSLPAEQIIAFLAGYLDSDGHVNKNSIAYTSVNKEVLEKVKLLAISLGFGVSRIFKHREKGKKIVVGRECDTKDSWRILLNGKNVYNMPTKSLEDKEKINKLKTQRNFFGSQGLNFRSKANEEVGFAKIEKILPTGEKPTYDIEVYNYHNFISNGFIAHNSNVTMLYPCSVLLGKNSKTDYIGVAYAGKGQNQDTGCKVYHLAPNTSSTVISKSISKDGGITNYRGLVEIKKGCVKSKSSVRCDGLMLDNNSKSGTIPSMNVSENDVKVAHEAAVGKIGEEQLFYLMSRGLSEQEATMMIVSGFIEPVVKALPLEYAVELNRLIELEIENSVC